MEFSTEYMDLLALLCSIEVQFQETSADFNISEVTWPPSFFNRRRGQGILLLKGQYNQREHCDIFGLNGNR